jgi:hypothetical protein
MNLSNLSDEMLDSANIKVAKDERDVLTKVLLHLRESERRRLFSKYKYESLHEYAIKRMGYTADQAQRRISAMRLLKELPQIQAKIERGALNLTHLNQANALFRQENKAQVRRTQEEKLELLSKIEHQPRRTLEKILEKESFIKPLLIDTAELHSLKPVDIEQFPKKLQEKIKRLMEVRAHAHAKDLLSAIEQAVDLALEKWDPMGTAHSAPARKTKVETKVKSKYIPVAIRSEVFMRDRGECRNCGSRNFLQIDHVIPFAKGGESEVSNLRLLCRSCNQRHAIECYGSRKMNTYLKEPRLEYSAFNLHSKATAVVPHSTDTRLLETKVQSHHIRAHKIHLDSDTHKGLDSGSLEAGAETPEFFSFQSLV